MIKPRSILAFTESWLSPSYINKFNKNLAALASKFPSWSQQILQAEDNQDLIKRFQIEYLPAIVIYQEEERFQVFDGNSLLKPLTFHIRKINDQENR